MIIKARCESDVLKGLRILSVRGELTKADKDQLWRLERGYAGEVQFDKLTDNLPEECFIIRNLLMEVNGKTFQIDTVIITQGIIYFIDVKNNEDEYYVEKGELYTLRYRKLCENNPFEQLKRAANLFRSLLEGNGFHFLLDAKLVFVNPEFTLYQAPIDESIILPTKVKRFVQSINQQPSRLNQEHKRLANLLLSLHIAESPFEKLPSYKYEQLKKGINCAPCKSFNVSVSGHNLVCGDCGAHEGFESAVLRSVEELKFLFPGIKITTALVFDWCGGTIHKRVIWNVLKKNFKPVGSGRWLYFE